MWERALFLLLIGCLGNALGSIEDDARSFVLSAEDKLMLSAEAYTFADWNYESNITKENQKIKLAHELEHNLLKKTLGKEAKQFDLNKIEDYDVKRKLKFLAEIGTSVLEPEKLKEFSQLKSDMAEAYSTAKVPDFESKKEQYSLEPELTEIMSMSRDPEKLQYYWEQWRDATGKKIKDMYKTYIDYYNEAATLNGYKDASLMKVNPYESETFIDEMAATWEGLKPLYQQLHAYVRNKLSKHYGEEVVANEGAIPAHLLGNMWAQSWTNMGDILRPYPNKGNLNVTGQMVSQNWTQEYMFEKADDFFQSLGLIPVPEEFWNGSILKKPDDGRELTCHASAWDFYNGKDFRIKQCTRVDQKDFVVVNHEMGHIQYFLLYKHQSHLYRDGANPGFHEGVADILSLAVGTSGYYRRLGLVGEEFVEDKETDINLLFDMALERIAFLPFGYLVDKYRWDLYSGVASKDNMNCHWWKLRYEIQGLKPPTKRNNDQFDAGAKYHVAADVGYVRYFTAFIYEFQFYKALCLESGEYVPEDPEKPLHKCNFYGSKKAGDKLREMLSLGSSRPWKEAMTVMTGQPDMNTDAIREYFAPLEKWLKSENEKNGVVVGWDDIDSDASLDQMCETS